MVMSGWRYFFAPTLAGLFTNPHRSDVPAVGAVAGTSCSFLLTSLKTWRSCFLLNTLWVYVRG